MEASINAGIPNHPSPQKKQMTHIHTKLSLKRKMVVLRTQEVNVADKKEREMKVLYA